MNNVNLSLKSALAIPFTLGLFTFGAIVLRSKGISTKGAPKRESRPGAQTPMKIQSQAFENKGMIPTRYTCDGENVSSPLEISDVPMEAQSLALIMHDGDAPVPGGWTHWTLFNIDPATVEIAENSFPPGAIQGNTSLGVPGYGGPCPPSGTHHYEFRLYALDTRLALGEDAKKSDIERAMEGHILAQDTLIGLYASLK
jgi:Raf kinase inhibitor-like YbhB/YbcL family protein